MRTVRHLAREPEMLRVYERVLRSEMRRQDRAGLVWRLFDPLRALGDHVVEVLCLFYGSVLISTGSMQPAELSMVLSMADSTFDQIRWLQSSFSVLGSDVMEPVAQILSLLSRKPKIGLQHHTPPSKNLLQSVSTWSIEFRDVTFAYVARISLLYHSLTHNTLERKCITRSS
jgi:ABC-type multidrug transport system fused ATPase/permease subunit